MVTIQTSFHFDLFFFRFQDDLLYLIEMATSSTKPNMVSMTSAVVDLKGDDKHKRYNALVRIRKQFLKEPDGYKRFE